MHGSTITIIKNTFKLGSHIFGSRLAISKSDYYSIYIFVPRYFLACKRLPKSVYSQASRTIVKFEVPRMFAIVSTASIRLEIMHIYMNELFPVYFTIMCCMCYPHVLVFENNFGSCALCSLTK